MSVSIPVGRRGSGHGHDGFSSTGRIFEHAVHFLRQTALVGGGLRVPAAGAFFVGDEEISAGVKTRLRRWSPIGNGVDVGLFERFAEHQHGFSGEAVSDIGQHMLDGRAHL